MSENFGNGVTRTLSAGGRQFQVVVWQANRPPLDSELNLVMQADWERLSNKVRSEMHSGFLLDPYQSDKDFITDPAWSNFFKIGRTLTDEISPVLWANVNGWIVPVSGTNTDEGDPSNRVNLYPPPSSDARVDFVFLEVWLAQVAPSASTINKPSASTIYKYGNVLYGGTNIPDDLQDPGIGFETTERIQLQYRLRVVGSGAGLGDSVDLSSFPDGLDDPNVLAQGASSAPQTGFTWVNMRDVLGDPGLWRSGDGDSTNVLGTVDGYSYSIPVCAIFRRNSLSFVARTDAGNAQQNAAFDRNPITVAITDPSEATLIFGELTLTSSIDGDGSVASVVQVENLADSGYDNTDLDWSSTFLRIDGEIIGVTSVSTSTTPGTITIPAGGRGRFGTQATPHTAGAGVTFWNFRPDGKFSDEVNPLDLLDLRKGVSSGEWDYNALLTHNLGKLFQDSLRSSYKQSGISDTQGTVVLEVDTLYTSASNPNQTEALDGPDGIRTVFSDASVVESNVSLLLAPSTSGSSPTAVSSYTTETGSWGPAAAFVPDGFQADGSGWADQTIINLYIGGATGNGGARATVRDTSENAIVRFVTPREYWLTRDEIDMTSGVGKRGNQYPFQFRLIEEGWGDPVGADEPSASHPGPMFPLPEYNFERPFIVLGGVVNSNLVTTSAETVSGVSVPSGVSVVRFAGLDFDSPGVWYPVGEIESLSTENVSEALLYKQRTLFDMLTVGGRDRSGTSSELYLVLSGDLTNAENSGVFRVIGAGTVGFTTESGPTAEDLVVVRVGEGSASVVSETGLDASVRSQYTHAEDGTASGEAAAVVVLTDLAGAIGGDSFPWAGLFTPLSQSQAVLDTSILYGPSRGGTARVAGKILRIAMADVDSAVLVREAPTAFDPDFESEAGVPEGEVYFPFNHVQTWNRLPSLGLSAPRAPDYGGGSHLGEYRREAEVFVDAGSKTLVLRPYQLTDLTLNRYQATEGSSNRFIPSTYTAGDSLGITVDGGGLFKSSADYAYAFPLEFMPRFGRQDIPFHQTTGITGPVYYGVNHLFGDSQTDTDDVFRVLGGVDDSSSVISIFFQTGSSSGRVYGEYFTLAATSEGYQARIYEDVNVISTDLPRGLKGIQLPPFLGIARLYGVYDLREYSGSGAWEDDRVTPNTSVGRPRNLLKEDADKQTLFIVKGGASDVTGDSDDHTYVIPSNLIDVRRSGEYIEGETFDDLEFVVECVVFGFARGFINKNNYVLARKTLPDGTLGVDAEALATEVACVLPLPLPLNEQLYVVYERTVYQGDPYMTRDGATKVVSDYETRYGQIPSENSSKLSTPIQQYDSTQDYAQVPEIPNARSLEVLAFADFYTTLGTGKIGGRIYPGTLLDVGHLTTSGLAPTRIAPEEEEPLWPSQVRTFTEPPSPLKGRSVLSIRVLKSTIDSDTETVTLTRGKNSVTFVSGVAPFQGVDSSLAARGLTLAIGTSEIAKNVLGVQAFWDGASTVDIVSLFPGEEGQETTVSLGPATAPSARLVTGFRIGLMTDGSYSRYGFSLTSSPLVGGESLEMNATLGEYAQSPIQMTGLTERLPLGILLQDSDFLGEDPLINGVSSLQVTCTGGAVGSTNTSPLQGTLEYGRLQGAGQIGMADGSILNYTPWTLSTPTGTKKFRLFRGGGSAYVLDPAPPGGPLDWASGGLPANLDPVLKGGVLAGRAYLVRNYKEEAFSSSEVRTYGDELQMVIVTRGVLGEGPLCERGYSLDGQISPTGFGDGYAASDRYRLEGKPLVAGHTRVGADPNVPLAPYPSEDEAEDDGC